MTRPNIDSQITFFYTRDLKTTAHFYENIMDLSLVLDQGGCRIYEVNGDAYVGFCERDWAPKNQAGALDEPASVLFTLVTDEVDAWYEHLSAQNVPFDKTPAVNETYGIYHCFVRDPNGYMIEIQRFLDADWNKVAGDEKENIE